MRNSSALLASALAVLVAAAARAQTDRMFVTSAKGNGDLSSWPQADGLHGLAAGNRICQNLAAAAHLANASTFQAWLSDASTDAACNIKARSGHPPTCGAFTVNNPGPWARTDGAPFARSVASLTAGEVLTIPRFDENGSALPVDVFVWTGTRPNGTLNPLDCSDSAGAAWNDTGALGAAGNLGYGPAEWTERSFADCTLEAHLYCFQHSLFGGPPFAPFEREGTLVFHTSTGYPGKLDLAPEAAGLESLAAGDAICRARARAGGLPAPDSFHAWLSVSSVSALDHLDHDGPFKRPDGIEIADSKADLTDGELANAIVETERLAYSVAAIWTGTDDTGGYDDRNCDDWTQDSEFLQGLHGHSGGITHWSEFAPDNCSAQRALYCFSDIPVLFWTGFEESGGLWRWSVLGG
jgi:hypothetical protein